MADTLVDRRDVAFVLYEQFDILKLTERKKFQDFSRDEFDMTIDQALKFAENDLAPINAEGDRTGAQWKDGAVTLPESFHRALKLFGEGGWVGACEDPEDGGQGLPVVVYTACNEIFHAANTALNLYPSLAHGTFTMIKEHGTEEQKRKYLDKLLSYEWAGSMNLTEPGAGSSLAHVSTKAEKIDERHYKITGQKIFITGGEHDAHPNIVHPVLARIEGDPEGIKGISIFLVPKYHVNGDGTPGERNDVVCAGVEHKMGIKGSATCQMSFGDSGNCVGEILGKPRQGIGIMFLIMNEERLNVGVQSVGLSSAAYLSALKYARERVQGVDVRQKGGSKEPVTIINHPDVRRNLLEMKSFVEGIRALNYYTAFLIDIRNAEEDEEKRKEYDDMVEFFTPLCKAYSSELGHRVCSNAMNVFGGYGYCMDYPVEQYLRDQKITALYEGTNAIHSIDLLSRKIRLGNGAVFKTILSGIDGTVARASGNPRLAKYAGLVKRARNSLEEAADLLLGRMDEGKTAESFLHSLPFLEAVGDVVLGWLHLWQLDTASRALDGLWQSKGAVTEEQKNELVDESRDAAFYTGKIQSARHFINTRLPLVESKVETIRDTDCPALEIPETAFGAIL
ncbi:MAG TPA: acyl-CoA dehydrogenase [Spirochaetes bacterium]|nr:acyl-CoA dehydrogenase [Spirochaetota bacterium]